MPAAGLEPLPGDDENGGTRAYETPVAAEPPAATEVKPTPVRAAVVVAGVSRELDRPVLSVGRSRECDIAIDDPSVSRRHAELRRETQGYAIVDLGSTNGTQVNGEKVSRAKLQPGDRITLGQTELRFEHL